MSGAKQLIALVAYVAIALGAFWYFETPSIGCGQIRKLGDQTGATMSGAYYCHIIVGVPR